MDFSSLKIEQIAVNRVKDVILNYNKITSFINENDKEPSWDGHIYVYSNKNLKKENFKGRIPVQVKGKQVQKFSKEKRTYKVELNDLNSYFIDNGVMYFVVEMKSYNEVKIFYSTLLPQDLIGIIEEVEKNNKKSKA